MFDSYTKLSVQSKAAIWFAICTVLQKGISFITVPLFTRLLTAEEYGTYSLYLSWFQIMTMITSLYLYFGVFNNGMNKYDNNRDVYISSMQGLTLTITLCVFVVYLIGKQVWNNLFGLSDTLILMMFVALLVNPSIHFWSGRQRFEFKYKTLVAVTLGKSIANPLLGFILVILSDDKSTARIISVVIVELAFSGFFMIYQFLRGKCFFHRYYWKYALGLAVPLVPHYLSTIILVQGDRVMIDHMAGKSEVAFYSVAYSVGMLVQIVTSAITHSFTPWMYQNIKANSISDIKCTVNMLLLITASLSLMMMMCSPEIVMIFGPSEYSSAEYVIPPVAASVFFIFLYNILAIPQFYFERTRFLAVSSIIATVLNIVLNYIFISLFGYVAAGYTTLACYVMYSIGHYYVSKRVLFQSPLKNLLFDQKFILILSLFIIFIGISCNFVFDYWIVRYSILILACVFVYMKRNELKRILNGFPAR